MLDVVHILNLMVQDCLPQIKDIIEDIYDSVLYIKLTEGKLIIFSEIVQQLQLPYRKLILDCRTRWTSTYEMLATALKFKEVFARFKEREPHYNFWPNLEDWEKVEKVCEILKVFNSTTNIISGSDYPTSNVFLIEVCRVKVLLDKKSQDENEFIQDMVKKMKDKFDKYWEECNLLMAIAAVLDPRCKMKVIDFCFSKMYPKHEARENILRVQEALSELYGEYVVENQSSIDDHIVETDLIGGVNVIDESSGWSEFAQFLRAQKSELDCYLEEGCHRCKGDPNAFDALKWWEANNLEYPILSMMACDILVIPITTVASEDTYSAGSRVIDDYRASLSQETVQMLLCGGDWRRNLNGVKKINKEELEEIILPIPSFDEIQKTV
ncbi:zinc finger BED domain-containing protein RICESLEEPER 2-like isoform X2 [Pistacia vera]|uniref:zinc finger BED domain-containing protein RICESLEEPER 2-like isoform X2 n=1 Tax=Pistacia vera TaxID=55513 RepID=UPI0012634C59|nr:zinc finger BED domain-containing protein RICESLEEPER 2-like isoform X2 [Pistacia vera]XP_031270900.1 zinc finger BED domain-containing protein RICESLEEPER 2-like isoform X2 [Pistacia vera]XP_031270901.1 zinc finger BED domain-containing protein RICESLEEPER 2-like isoform X2 [Pistacia vera]XP_031270902.1 zinc finger BED domain-containing protein RICESLEEPER 2-like isoform X2 [Pistacia vera]XP_031270903.1 zinc finger BED domain-containing protein RICESLEEPER 2-like isoform X2 [Pistacia vera]